MKFIVNVPDMLVREAGAHETAEYIREAVQNWGGGRHPDDPFCGGAARSITVRFCRKEDAS